MTTHYHLVLDAPEPTLSRGSLRAAEWGQVSIYIRAAEWGQVSISIGLDLHHSR